MPDIVCPECGQTTSLVAFRRAAEEFCSHCDYPLFWAPSAVRAGEPGASNTATLRRLPGAGGRQRVGSKVCPECGELNPLGETHCVRCSADLDPAPAPPPPPPPPPAPVVAPPPPEVRRSPWWIWPAIAAVVIIEVIAIVFWLR